MIARRSVLLSALGLSGGLPASASAGGFAHELALLRDARLRRAGPGPLHIRGRSFDSTMRFDTFEWDNIRFERCDFRGCSMSNGILKQVEFIDCLFFANKWSEGRWDKVRFTDCAGRGPFAMTSRLGDDITFDQCEFTGATADELGYGGRSEQFGNIGGTNGAVIYRNCRFLRMYVYGGASLQLEDCTMEDVVIDAQDGSTIGLLRVRAKGMVDVGAQMGKYQSVTVRASTFTGGALVFDGARIERALFEEVTANLDLMRVKAHSIILRKVIFSAGGQPDPRYKYGLHTKSAKIGSLRIEDCGFDGPSAALYLSGTNIPGSASKTAKDNVYSTGIKSLAIVRTPIQRAAMRFLDVRTWTLQDTSVSDSDLSNSVVGALHMKNVKLSGKVDFSSTFIGVQVMDNVVDGSTGTKPTVGKAN